MGKKPIAIIGGMGPEASAYMYSTLISNSAEYFNAKHNDDFPEITLYSVPVPDFISSLDREDEALEMLRKRVADINKQDVLCGAIACNTAHKVLPDLQSVATFPFISMIDEVVKKVKEDELKTIGLLGTPSTLRSSMYQDALKEEGVAALLPTEDELARLENIIRNVIGNSIDNNDKEILKAIMERMKEDGAEGIILGCTELPLVSPQKFSLKIYNSVEILSIALLTRYYK